MIPRKIAIKDLAAHLSYTIEDWTRGYRMQLPRGLAVLLMWLKRNFKPNKTDQEVSDYYFKELFPKFKAMTSVEREQFLLQMPSGFYRAEFRMHHMLALGKYEIYNGRTYTVEDYSI